MVLLTLRSMVATHIMWPTSGRGERCHTSCGAQQIRLICLQALLQNAYLSYYRRLRRISPPTPPGNYRQQKQIKLICLPQTTSWMKKLLPLFEKRRSSSQHQSNPYPTSTLTCLLAKLPNKHGGTNPWNTWVTPLQTPRVNRNHQHRKFRGWKEHRWKPSTCEPWIRNWQCTGVINGSGSTKRCRLRKKRSMNGKLESEQHRMITSEIRLPPDAARLMGFSTAA